MKLSTKVTELLNIEFPIIMAPMFLVSNEAMVTSAMESGIMGCFPSLNYRNEGEFEAILDKLNNYKEKNKVSGNYGVNLIVQKTNPLFVKHLKVCVDKKVPFYITSLGHPGEVIEKAHSYGAKVFCDVTNVEHAQKCFDLKCDGFIAVGQGAGGHAGPFPLQLLVPTLKKHFPSMPVVSAGSVATGAGIVSMLALGAEGVSIGTRYIACNEAGVNDAYKNAIVDAKMKDIVLTERISGTPCTIIDTPYAKKTGYKLNWWEKKLSKNPRTKKYYKLLLQYRGMLKLEKSIKPAGYDTLWCAGQSVEMIDEVMPVKQVTNKLMKETFDTLARLAVVGK